MRGSSIALVCAAILAAAIAAYVAYSIVGWIGVGVFGLLTAFVAVQAEMDDIAPIGGSQTGGLYASVMQAREQAGRGEKAARQTLRLTKEQNKNILSSVQHRRRT